MSPMYRAEIFQREVKLLYNFLGKLSVDPETQLPIIIQYRQFGKAQKFTGTVKKSISVF